MTARVAGNHGLTGAFTVAALRATVTLPHLACVSRLPWFYCDLRAAFTSVDRGFQDETEPPWRDVEPGEQSLAPAERQSCLQ